jgi:hypothetical protein
MLSVKEGALDADGNRTVELEVIRANSSSRIYSLTPVRSWYGVRTNVSIVKVENTNLVQSITTEVEDKRLEFVKSAAKLVGTAIGVSPDAAEGGVSPDMPKIHDLGDLLANASPSDPEKKVEISSLRGIKLTVWPVSSDALDPEKQEPSDLQRLFVFSACRQAEAEVTVDGKKQLLRFAVADPRRIQTVALPRKGQIVAHSECGVSVVPEKVELTSDLDVLEAVISEIRSLKKADADQSE